MINQFLKYLSFHFREFLAILWIYFLCKALYDRIIYFNQKFHKFALFLKIKGEKIINNILNNILCVAVQYIHWAFVKEIKFEMIKTELKIAIIISGKKEEKKKCLSALAFIRKNSTFSIYI